MNDGMFNFTSGTWNPSSDDLRYDQDNSVTTLDMFFSGVAGLRRLGMAAKPPIGLRIAAKVGGTVLKGSSKSLAWTKNMKNSLSGKNLSKAELRRYRNRMNSKTAKATMGAALLTGWIVTNLNSLSNLAMSGHSQSNDYIYGSRKVSREKWLS